MLCDALVNIFFFAGGGHRPYGRRGANRGVRGNPRRTECVVSLHTTEITQNPVSVSVKFVAFLHLLQQYPGSIVSTYFFQIIESAVIFKNLSILLN